MSSKPIDWSQLWYPGPARAFSAAEMARAGADAPSRTLVTMVGINVALVGFLFLQLAPREETARLTAAMVAVFAAGSAAARWLWWRPWRGPLLVVSVLTIVTMVACALTLRWAMPLREQRYWLALLLGGSGALLPVGLWFLVVWRAQQIESRLREQAERERAVEMAQRLVGAQLAPHFLFNTLASVQHWVQTHDERAGPLLAALTGYLRATLPLFSRALHPLADELQLVERYLQVMQARMGERLAWRFEVEPALQTLPLPPGLLLTLVENAIEHGLQPSLRGGALTLRGWREGPQAVLEVLDDGAGLQGAPADGVGLANVRQRLALTCGEGASLSLAPASGGGCRAVVRLPVRPALPSLHDTP